MAESDPGETFECYEFDAPCQIVDLKELDKAENDDSWFEQQARAGNGHLSTPYQPFVRNDVQNLPKASVSPQVRTEVPDGPSTSRSPPSNLVKSWDSGPSGARPKGATNQPPVKPTRVSKRKTTNATGDAPTSAPLSKKQKKSPVARPAPKRSLEPRRKGQLNSRHVPKPRMSATSSANPEPSSSEEQELERIRNLQKEVALHRKKNEASYKAALAGDTLPKKMVLSVTVPEEFNFNTRAKAAASSAAAASKDTEFTAQLRKPSSPAKAMKGPTVPKPFNLSTGNKRKMDEPPAYVPMAQQIAQFQKRTPDRYHLRSRQSQERGPGPVKADHLKLTHPHTPHLMTRQRSRPTTVKSSAELEAEEAEKLQKFKFKALELNKKILESAEDLKKPAAKEPTVPEGFELQIEKRLQERQATKPKEDEKPHNFKSQPLPKKIIEGVVGVPEKKVVPPTVPESPAFALKKRIHTEPKVEKVKPPSPIRAPPVPHFGLPFQPRLPESHHVEVCPFSFEERERERRALKEKRLDEKRNEEVPQFKAQPLPDFDTVVLPEKKKLEPTKPEPFRLLLDERGAVRSVRWEQMVKEEQKQQEEAAVFKARPNTVTQKEPFQPKKESRIAAVAESFELSTERRARERQEFERLANEKEALRARMEEEQRREEEKREKEEIARLRQEQVHKAQPIRHYKPVELRKSEAPLTVPKSPKFSDRFRL